MMRLLMICIAVTLVAAETKLKADKGLNYNSLNGELDSILEMSKNINSMTPEELLQLSARVDGTLKKLEMFAEKRLGLSVHDDKLKRSAQQDGEEVAPPAAAEPASGIGAEGMAGIIQMFTSMFSGMLPALQAGSARAAAADALDTAPGHASHQL